MQGSLKVGKPKLLPAAIKGRQLNGSCSVVAMMFNYLRFRFIGPIKWEFLSFWANLFPFDWKYLWKYGSHKVSTFA